MSKEKDNELNEQELWDLLKEPEEKTESKPQPAPEKRENKTKTVITEKRKKALVWYLVGLFGIAFVVVLLSLFLRGNSGNTPDPDAAVDNTQMQELYDRINDLEDENAALEAENQQLKNDKLELQEMMDGLNLMIDEMSNSLEYVEGNALYSDENAELLARTMAAYETLVRAQNAFIDYDEQVLEEAMAELENNLDLLSQDALNAYFMVIEYMEQPYLGQ